MIEVKTNSANIKWRVYFYVNTYPVVVNPREAARDKYWIDLLRSDDTHAPVVGSFQAIQAKLPSTSELRFDFVPTLFDEYYSSLINAEDCVRMGRGVFIEVVKTYGSIESYYEHWVWHGRIVDVRKENRLWQVRAVGELDLRLRKIIPGKPQALFDPAVDYVRSDAEYQCDTNVSYSRISNIGTFFRRLLLQDYPISGFDPNNGCSIKDIDMSFTTSTGIYDYPCMPASIVVRDVPYTTIIENLLTKRFCVFTWRGGYDLGSGDYANVFVPYQQPIIERIMNKTIPITLDYSRVIGKMKWKTHSGNYANKVSIIYKGTAYEYTVSDATSNFSHLCLGQRRQYIDPNDPDHLWYVAQVKQTLHRDTTKTLGEILGYSGTGDIPIRGITFGSFKLYYDPSADLYVPPLLINMSWYVGSTEYTRQFGELLYLGSCSHCTNVFIHDFYIDFGNPFYIPSDATQVAIELYSDYSNWSSEPDRIFANYWMIEKEWGTTYPDGSNGALYYKDFTTNPPSWVEESGGNYKNCLKMKVRWGENPHKLYSKELTTISSQRGVSERIFKYPIGIGDENVRFFADEFLKYSQEASNQALMIDSGEITLRRLADFPFVVDSSIKLRPGWGVKIYDPLNNIGTSTNPVTFVLDKVEFDFPECLFKFHLAGLPLGDAYLIYDKIKTTQDTILQSL